MLNIHTHLLDLVKNKTINSSEFFILLLICKRINQKGQSFPSLTTLMEESQFGKTKVEECISTLVKKGFLERKQRRVKLNNGREVNSSNLYTIKTKLISIFVNLHDKELEQEVEEDKELSATVFQGAQNQSPQNQALSIKQSSLSIKQSIEERKETPSCETPNSTEQSNINSLSLCELIGIDKDNIQGKAYSFICKLVGFFQSKKLTINDLKEVLAMVKDKDKTLANKLNSMHWGGWIKAWEAKKAAESINQFTITKIESPENLTLDNIKMSKYANEFQNIIYFATRPNKNGIETKADILEMLKEDNEIPNYSKYQHLADQIFSQNLTNI